MQDFAPATTSLRTKRWPRWWPWLALAIAVLALAALLLAREAPAAARLELGTSEQWLDARVFAPPRIERRSVHVRRGDAPWPLLLQLGLSPQQARAVLAAAGDAFSPLAVGDEVVLEVANAHRRIVWLRRHRPAVVFEERNESWQRIDATVQARRRLVGGVIEDSLFSAAERAGLDETTTMNLVDIFAWDIDFARDLHPGDRFRAWIEEHYDAEGRYIGATILAAEFVVHNRRYRAVRFEIAPGRFEYFAPDGTSMRKNYLRAPLRYTRISSRFSLHRRHPLLGYTRAHRGVDYAAPYGTPVRAVGAGVVTFAGWKGGYGRMVEIRHTNRMHRTRYAHLSRFARGIRRGVRVRQGQVIGYVGQSGLATGPHLHFEFRIRGRAVNPLSIHRKPARPVPKALRARFEAEAQKALAKLSQPVILAAWE